MRVRAKFRGQDGSMGLQHGAYYLLDVSHEDQTIYVHIKGRSSRIPYSSLSAYLRNWTEIDTMPRLPNGLPPPLPDRH